MPKQRNNIIGVLDIGTSKIVCFIARLGFHGKVEVMGIGHHLAQGIRAGVITDIRQLEHSVAAAVEAAEKMAGETIQRVYVSISPNNCISQIVHGEMVVTGREISERDEKKLFFQIMDRFSEQNLEVIHSFPYEYVLDGNRGITSPIGMTGDKLSCDYHIISVSASSLNNLSTCLARCQLEIEGYVCASYATGLACLDVDETKLGVTMIEFGGNCTSVSVFHRGHLIFTDGIPIGGISITNDIALSLSTDYTSAERVKNLYGTVIGTAADHSEKIEVPISSDRDGEMNVVSRSLLIEIIRARVEEILDIIKNRLEHNEANMLSGNKIVITGGASQLSGTRDLVAHLFSKTVRLGYPRAIDGLAESTYGPAFPTAIGLLIYAVETEGAMRQQQAGQGFLRSMFNWFKENFTS